MKGSNDEPSMSSLFQEMKNETRMITMMIINNMIVVAKSVGSRNNSAKHIKEKARFFFYRSARVQNKLKEFFLTRPRIISKEN